MKKKGNLNHRLIWVKYLAKYLMTAFGVIICCIPFALDAYSRIDRYAIATSTRQLEVGTHQLDNDVEKMQMIAAMLGEENIFLELQRIKGDIPTEKYLYMGDAKERLMEISYIYDFADCIFCIYRDNDIFISNNQVSESLENYYGKFLKCNDLTASEFKEQLFQAKENSGYMTVETFSYYSSKLLRQVSLQNAVLYVQSVGGESYGGKQKTALVFVIDQQKLKDLFLDESIQDKATFLVLNRANQEVASSGSDVEALRQNLENTTFQVENRNYQIVSSEAVKGGLKIIIGFLEENIYEQIGEMRHMFFRYVLCGCGAALLFTVISAYIWYKPFRKMLTEVSAISGKQMEKENEYEYIRNSVLKLASDKNDMEAKMLLVNVERQAVMLEKIFSNGFSNAESKEWFEQTFPWFEKGYQIIRLWIRSTGQAVNQQEGLIYITDLFEKEWGTHFAQIHLQNHTAVWMVAEQGEAKPLEDILRDVCSEAQKQYEIEVVVGISEKQEDLERVSIAYAQARQIVNVYRELNGSFVERYQKIYNAEIGYFRMDAIKNLYEFVMRGNRKAIEDSFAQMRQEVQSSYEKYSLWKYEIYYSINFSLQSVCRQKSLPVSVRDYTNAELQNMTLVECLDKLKENAILICEGVELQKSNKNDIQRQQIMEYIKGNFRRMELTLSLVAQETDLAEKYVYAIVKEETGKTFSVYLDELRVAYAKECLETTAWSNEKIASEAGFGAVNSFYRIFKKYTGYSPGFYRKESK